jgi:hypothetical protein
MEYTGTIEWKLTKEMVENELGYKISDEDFILFAKHFNNSFNAQFEDTLSWQASDWDEVKEWSL